MMGLLAALVIATVTLVLAELPENANDYFLLQLHRDLVTMRMQFSQMEQKFNKSQATVKSLEAEVRRLKMTKTRHQKVSQGTCSFCKTQLENLEAGLLMEKWRFSRVDKAVEKIKNRLGTVTQLAKDVDFIQNRLQTMTQLDQTVESIQDRVQELTQWTETVESTQDEVQIYKTRLEEIKRAQQTRWYVRGGRVNKDDAVSRADCSPGSVVECKCSNESKACDGVEVQGRKCLAAKSGDGYYRSGIWARATCEESGRYQVIRSPVNGFNGNPLAKCPPGTQVTRCWLRNWWMHEKYIGTIKDSANNTCKPEPGCEKRKTCIIHALCKTK
ncbi:uncharacterized protein LOC135479658 [Liolophura sinensis]|uniref:uncharacterized protein LOC135479658 n=1 Tax=Liolophura sinensis TaxID=3198878 RepID=UPI00315934F4